MMGHYDDCYEEDAEHLAFDRRCRTREVLTTVTCLGREVDTLPFTEEQKLQLRMKVCELEALLKLWGLFDE